MMLQIVLIEPLEPVRLARWIRRNLTPRGRNLARRLDLYRP
jgi:hypothetical protein